MSGVHGDNTSDFDIHLHNIKYIVFNEVKNLNLVERNNLLSINILRVGQELQRTVRALIADGQGGTAETAEIFRAEGNRLLCAYFMQYTSTGRPEADGMVKFLAEKEVIMAIVEIMRANDAIFQETESHRSGRRRFQTHPILRARLVNSFYETIVPGLKEYGPLFQEYTKMSQKQFDFLLHSVRSRIEKDNTRRDVIPPDFRLLITLRHLVAGDSFFTLSLTYLLGKSTVRGIVYETCQAIWDAFSDMYIVWPNDLRKSSENWYTQHQLPHCVGAVDGKHIRIQKPANSQTLYFNYKKFFSIVLMAVCDADCNFIYVSIGEYGSQSDGSSWAFSTLGTAMDTGQIPWPNEEPLPDSDIPFGYFLIGDEAFQLSKKMLRPYSGRNLPADQKLYNERLAVARSTIERTFGILANRFRIFRQEIAASPEHVEVLVQAAVTLHNFINKTKDDQTPLVSDCMPPSSNFLDQTAVGGRSARAAQDYRNIYKDYLSEN